MTTDINRRDFIKTTAAAGAAVTFSALSYSRVLGANDRIRIAQIGCGDRGVTAHLAGIQPFAQSENVEVVAVSDPWRQARERAVAAVKESWGREPAAFISHRDALTMKEVDAVMIASPDHLHSRQLQDAAKAGKDAYCEKPMAKNLKELLKAYDEVKRSGILVQIGTQLRSLPTAVGCKAVYESGIFGKVSRIEQCRNANKPYWYHYIRPVAREDVDWNEFWLGKPKVKFDSVRYSAWYGYRETCDGPVPQWGSHFIDTVHYITGATVPVSCVCHGGTFTWKDENQFTTPDHVQALWIYPQDFMVSYSTNLGNDYGNSYKLYGDQGVLKLDNLRAPVYTAEGGSKNKGVIKGVNDVTPIDQPDHFLNWLQCLRSRKQPHAPIEAGFQHSIACLMAVESFYSGRRISYDPHKRSFTKE